MFCIHLEPEEEKRTTDLSQEKKRKKTKQNKNERIKPYAWKHKNMQDCKNNNNSNWFNGQKMSDM